MTVKCRFVSSLLTAVYHGVLWCHVTIVNLDKRDFFLLKTALFCLKGWTAKPVCFEQLYTTHIEKESFHPREVILRPDNIKKWSLLVTLPFPSCSEPTWHVLLTLLKMSQISKLNYNYFRLWSFCGVILFRIKTETERSHRQTQMLPNNSWKMEFS